jgi:phosphogluconate dehydratase
VPAAIHVSPEAAAGGPLARLRDGDLVRVDGEAGTLEALVDAGKWATREAQSPQPGVADFGYGRELFAANRHACVTAEEGGVSWTA